MSEKFFEIWYRKIEVTIGIIFNKYQRIIYDKESGGQLWVKNGFIYLKKEVLLKKAY